MHIDTTIKTARNILMEYWPLNAFIATNPLWSLHDKPFFSAISHLGLQNLMPIDYYYTRYQQKLISNKDIILAIKRIENRSLNENQANQWVNQSLRISQKPYPRILFSDQLEEYDFQNPIVWIKERIFTLLRDYFGLGIYKENDLRTYWHEQHAKNINFFHNLQDVKIEDGILFLIQKMHIPKSILVDYLQSIYLQIYGWSSLMNWRNQHPQNPWIPGHDACENILFIWLSYEYLIANEKNIHYQYKPFTDLYKHQKQFLKACYIWQTAFELHYLNELSSKLNIHFSYQKINYDAQFIFCIDTRSERFRRHLESEGNVQTFGFAGFFGAIFNLHNNESTSYQSPALVSATHTATIDAKTNRLENMARSLKRIVNYTKKQINAPFSLFEMAGFWFLALMLFKMIQPKLKVIKRKDKIQINHSFSIKDKTHSACTLLKSIGLTRDFSQYVFICAHQSETINNPFKSSLNCGACGGNSGIPNAIIMCDILNDKEIRKQLKKYHIHIPDTTRFIAACHHTTNDRLSILQDEIPINLQKTIDRAALKLRHEKVKTLPGKNTLSEREQNWSELIPELGLINNACIIVGPRELTLNQNLDGRAFLHSYDPTLDENGEILASILSAPVVVAHWISSQYYFSTVNPNLFGAGNKAIHNVLPGIGVLEGNLSDLKIGLPLQSTHFKSLPIHEPRRIIVVVCAKKTVLDKAINSSPAFRNLMNNQWLHLKHIEFKIDTY